MATIAELFQAGNTLAGLGRFAEAARCYEQVVRLNPRHADALNNLGIVLKEQGRLIDALDCFRQSLALNPQHADALTNLGLHLAQQGQFAAAANSYDKALRVNPRHRLALGNRSLLRLLQGDFAAAWPDFEHRWARPGIVPRAFPQPRWDGSPLEGKTILVYEEQGLGDTIQFARYLPLVRARGGKVLFECPTALSGLFADFDGVDRLIPSGAPLPGFDVVIPLMSLPGVFGTALATVPAEVPYLRTKIDRKLATPQAGLDVGIVWQGSLNCQGDQRSVALHLFEPLSRLNNVRLSSLQIKPGSDQLRTVSFPIADLGNRFDPNSLDDLATAILQMDLVVTVDTSVAHLAGALGVPVWVVLPLVPDWRWLLERSDSPWYPTMRLFRQRRFGEWNDVFSASSRNFDRSSPVLRTGAKRCEMASLAKIFNDAVGLHLAGNLVQAEPLYRQFLALEPTNAQAHYMLGLLTHALGQPEAALAMIRRAGELNPALPGLQLNLGVVLLNARQLAEAAQCLQKALQANPHHAEARFNLGHVYIQLGRFAEATTSYKEALRLNPKLPYAHYNLAAALNGQGITLQTQGRLDDAILSFREALAINPKQADAHNNLGKSLYEQGRLLEAAQCYWQALQLEPDLADTHNNLGLVYNDQGQFADAANCFDKALEIDSGHKFALWNRCLSRLRHGDFEQGWPDFELRWAQPGMIPRSFGQPRWDGSPLHGKTILVYAEHGLGDTIQFMRYLPLVQKLGGTVIFECQTALIDLLRNVRGADQVFPAGAALPHFDVHVSLLSLPSFFLKPHAAIPADIPYLTVDSERVRSWSHELQGLNGLKVGISWQGSLNQKADRRTVALAEFMPLGSLKGVRLVSLQQGPGTAQLPAWRGSNPIVDWSERLNKDGSIVDTAAIMKNLDLVVTIDSAVAHLAGALGVPVWIALPFVPCWRYLIERADSPWYPTMRLFRQRNADDWPGVFQRIAAEMQALFV